jgi:hypothetical protein
MVGDCCAPTLNSTILGLVQNKKFTKWHRTWAVFLQSNARFERCFAGLRSVRPEDLRRVMISQPRRNPLAQNSLSRKATDHERCKRDGHQRFSGIAGVLNAGNLYISLHARPQLAGPLVPSSARGRDGGPRRSTAVVLNEQALSVAWQSHDGREKAGGQ